MNLLSEPLDKIQNDIKRLSKSLSNIVNIKDKTDELKASLPMTVETMKEINTLVNSGMITINEGRAMIDLPPIKDGDKKNVKVMEK